MDTKIFHSNNSALYFENKGKKILIDGIYGGNFVTGETIRDVGMSEMPEDYEEMFQQDQGIFQSLDLLLFSHCHHDHYDGEKVSAYRKRHPQVSCVEPKSWKNNAIAMYNVMATPCREGIFLIELDEVKIYIVPTVHLDLGKKMDRFCQVSHCSFLVDYGTETIFVAGDGELDDALYDILEENGLTQITYAFVNVIHLLTKGNMAFLKRIKPERIILYHLPDREDDDLNYWSLMEQAKKHHPTELPPLDVARHMEWLEL